MVETLSLRLSEPKKTHLAGKSLADSLYGKTDILLSGPLGAGKTTFLKGFAEGLGIQQHITSPTYALEQRYTTGKFGECIHVDLYRLAEHDAEELLTHTDDHEGIRCIEWAERAQSRASSAIQVQLNETDDEDARDLQIDFNDIPLPSLEQIEEWRKEVCVPSNVVNHCKAVANVCEQLAGYFTEQGIVVRTEALRCAGELHDLFRFIDFHSGSQHLNTDVTEEQRTVWKQWKETYPDFGHEEAAAAFVGKKGFPELGAIILPHGLRLKNQPRETIEQHILFYADKRVALDKVVTIDERFEDLKNRYCEGKETLEHREWYEECTREEQELFPSGPPAIRSTE